MIRPATPDDAAKICEIYNHYVRHTVVTFEETPVTTAEMARRIASVTTTLPWLVHESDAALDGYAYARAWRERSAYRYSVESTVYLRPDRTGRGIGGKLYRALLETLRDLPVHCVIGGVALPNPASVALHENLGFTKVGRFREVGFKLGRWVDVAYWQLVLSPGAPARERGGPQAPRLEPADEGA